MINIENWRPDTCECRLTDKFEYPDDGGHVIPLGYGGSVQYKCPAHVDVPDEELYEVLLGNVEGTTFGECRLKNFTLGLLRGDMEIKDLGLDEPAFSKQGNRAGKKLKDGIEYEWFFTGNGKNRSLHFKVKGIDLSQKKIKDIQDWCDNKFGVGRAKLI